MQSLYRKTGWRLLPLLCLAYMANSIDRINLSYAKLRMAADIGLDDAGYALAASAFFAGYILCELPSNLLMQKTGARATIARILLLWGLATTCTALVSTPAQLQAMRFLLGMAEAGFVPGVVLYLSYWFPEQLRARATSLLMMAGTLGAVISGPLAAGAIEHADGLAGLRGWQALFVLEGGTTMVLGVLAWRYLSNSPRQARWLTPAQQDALLSRTDTLPDGHIAWSVLRNRRCYLLGGVHFCLYAAINTVVYWTPSLLQDFGMAAITSIGLAASLPFAAGMLLMLWLGHRSDRHRERRWHTACAMAASALFFGLLGLDTGSALLRMALLTVGTAACMAALPVFWSIPPACFPPGQRAGGIAIVGSLGALAALLSPLLVSTIKRAGGSLYPAFAMTGLLLLFGAVLLMVGLPSDALRRNAE